MQPCADPALNRRDAAVLVALVLAVLALSYVWRAVLVTSDPWHYAQAALNFGTHQWIPAGLTRWGIIVPLLPVAALFGPTLPTFYAFAAMATALIVPMVYLLARQVGPAAVAALAVVAFVVQPLTFVNLTRGYPDLMAAALNALTLWLVLRGADRGRLPPLVLAGFAAGWAFEVRETTMFTWPIFAWVLWRGGLRWRGYAAVAAGLLPWAVLDIALSWATLADPLAKWHVLSGSDLNDSVSPLDGSYLGHDRWWYLARLPVAMAEQPHGSVLLLVCGLGIIGGVLLRGRVGLYTMWALLPAVLLALQAGVVDPGSPSVRVDVPRYWLAFTPGLTIAAVALCAAGARRLRGPGWLGALALVVLLAVPGVRYASAEPTFHPNSGSLPYRAAQALPEGTRVWTDGRTSRILPVYLNSAGKSVEIRDFTRRTARPEAGDYVLIFSDWDTTCEFCKLDYDLWRADGGSLRFDRYDMIWTSPDAKARLFRVDANG
jgi:hypothetical protein